MTRAMKNAKVKGAMAALLGTTMEVLQLSTQPIGLTYGIGFLVVIASHSSDKRCKSTNRECLSDCQCQLIITGE
jgi:hypothetical protein